LALGQRLGMEEFIRGIKEHNIPIKEHSILSILNNHSLGKIDDDFENNRLWYIGHKNLETSI